MGARHQVSKKGVDRVHMSPKTGVEAEQVCVQGLGDSFLIFEPPSVTLNYALESPRRVSVVRESCHQLPEQRLGHQEGLRPGLMGSCFAVLCQGLANYLHRERLSGNVAQQQAKSLHVPPTVSEELNESLT